ncbi:hypothetical protein Leryth_019489 [Lithospermum erythrorhizon]|nr:hypothetical protein Leryth_019489 [Lithospermum erythrorhizon]
MNNQKSNVINKHELYGKEKNIKGVIHFNPEDSLTKRVQFNFSMIIMGTTKKINLNVA